MWRVIERIRRLLHSEAGPTAIEYAVLIALLVLVCMAAVKSVGDVTAGLLQNSADAIAGAGGSGESGGSDSGGSGGSGDSGDSGGSESSGSGPGKSGSAPGRSR